MANSNNKGTEGKETVEFFQDLDNQNLQTERFMEKNAKLISIVFGALVVAVLGYFGYQQFVVKPNNEEATKSYLAAMKNLQEGKDADALGGKSPANPGFKGTFDKFEGTDVGKLAAYNAGLIKFKEGKYQEAYDLLDKFSSDNSTLMALKYGAMADCKASLNSGADAISLTEKAISATDDPYTTYYFTRKAGILSIALNKKAEAKKYFATIEEKYTDYDNGQSDAYIEMTKYY